MCQKSEPAVCDEWWKSPLHNFETVPAQKKTSYRPVMWGRARKTLNKLLVGVDQNYRNISIRYKKIF